MNIRNSDKLTVIVLFLIFVSTFVIGCMVSEKYYTHPLTTEQYNAYDQIARGIHNHGELSSLEPETKILITSNPTTINITRTGHSGKVTAISNNGVLVITHDDQIFGRFCTDIYIGAGFVFILLFVGMFGAFFYLKKQ